MFHDRRAFLAFAALCAAGTAGAQSADFPARPVTLISAGGVGSGPDIVVRLVATGLSQLWKQPVVVENRPGGGGFVAIEAARRAPADGYTLLQLDSEHLAALPLLYKSRNFETLKAFDPVAPLASTSFMVAVSAQSPWKGIADLIAAARAESGGVRYGSWGIGSPAHLGGAWMEMATNTTMSHVPFKETGQMLTSVSTGEVQWTFASIPSSQALYKAGKLRYLAVAGPRRMPEFPDVPTIAESGGPAGLDVSPFVLLLTPTGAPLALRNRIHADVLKVLGEPELRERFKGMTLEPLFWSNDEILRNAGHKFTQYKALIQKGGISLD